MKNINKLIWILLAGFLLIQFFRPENINDGKPTQDLVNVPKDVNTILRNSCFDCHSSEANLRWYDKITPANFLVNSPPLPHESFRVAFLLSNNFLKSFYLYKNIINES